VRLSTHADARSQCRRRAPGQPAPRAV